MILCLGCYKNSGLCSRKRYTQVISMIEIKRMAVNDTEVAKLYNELAFLLKMKPGTSTLILIHCRKPN